MWFYTDNGKTRITEITGSNHKDITVTISIPNNMEDYDSYTIDAYFGTRTDFARVNIVKDKNLVDPKYAGKKQITLLLISADGKNSDFTFSFTNKQISNKDLYNYPSKERIKRFNIDVKAIGRKIVSYTAVTELIPTYTGITAYPQYKGSVTHNYPELDNGKIHYQGTLVVNNVIKGKLQYYFRHSGLSTVAILTVVGLGITLLSIK